MAKQTTKTKTNKPEQQQPADAQPQAEAEAQAQAEREHAEHQQTDDPMIEVAAGMSVRRSHIDEFNAHGGVARRGGI